MKVHETSTHFWRFHFFKSKITFHPFSSIFINLNMTCHIKWRNSWMKFLEMWYITFYHTSSYLTDSFFAIDFPRKNVAPQGDLRQGEAHHPWRPGCARGGSGESHHQPEILRCLPSDRQKTIKNHQKPMGFWEIFMGFNRLSGWWFQTWMDYFSIVYGMSSFPLTFIFFKMVF